MNEEFENQPSPEERPFEAAPGDLASPAASREPEEPERPRRRLVKVLVGLYALSVLAAVVLLLRSPVKGESRKPLEGASALLAAAKHGDAVGLVTINGAIFQSQGGGLFERGSDYWGRRLVKLSEKKDVKAIVLEINSPGGSVGAVQELYSQIQRVRQETKKPIVAHLGDIAASGGYYLAAGCDKVVAQPGTLLGSIGVIFSAVNVEGLLQKLGIKSNVIKSGKMKDIGSMSRPMTEEERRLLQGLIDNAYGQFLHAVSVGRRIPEERLRPIADGRIFTGEQGKEAGLVDQLGDLREAVNLAAQLGGIKDAKPRVLRDTDFSNVFDLLDSKTFLPPLASLAGELRAARYSGLAYIWR